MDELRLAFRRLMKRPASTLASITTLAAAIGAAAVTWSALSAVLINPLPIRDAGGLLVVGIGEQRRSGPAVRTVFVYPAWHAIRESGVFERVTAQWASSYVLLVNSGGMPARTDVGFVMHDFFEVTGVQVALGRGFTPQDDRRGATPVALLTDRYWRTVFNADPSIVGRTIEIAGKPVAIVGVLGKRFRGMSLDRKTDVYLAFHTIADIADQEGNLFADPNHRVSHTAATMVLGRLAARMPVAEAEQRIRAVLSRQFGWTQAPEVVLLPSPLAAVPEMARAGMTRFAWLLSATVVLLVFIGCTTVGMLLLLRTEARRGEFAMCLALGASRARLARGIAVEGAILAGAGAVLAVPVGLWLLALVQRFELPGNISIELLELSLDGWTVAIMGTVGTAAVLLIALVAGAFGFRANVADALRTQSGTTPRVHGGLARAALVGGQIAVAVTLVAGAGLFARSLIAALRLNPGLDMSRVVIGTIQLQPYGYTPQRATEFFDTFRARLQNNTAIDTVSMRTYEGAMSPNGRILVDGVPRQFPSMVTYLRVDAEFFKTLNIQLREGRPFAESDRGGAPQVAIVSESFGRMLADGASPLGRRISGIMGVATPFEIVGVVSDVVMSVAVLEPLVLYVPAAQGQPKTYRDLTVNATAEAGDARREVMAVIRALDPQVIPTSMRTLEERVAAQMGPQRLGMTVLGALGGIAIFLTLLGTYVLADSMASARMREMGIRAALGATRRQLGSIILADTARLTVLGILAGLALAWMGTATIRSFLFQVQPFDPLTIGTVAFSMLALALAVSLRAALRVARVDLAQVLRSE